ncbi:hypothetical protein, partial [Klebsiella pneumoniae]|uniref:hypothetical protein n=1 Tax=Klebsiella pneumoniae TaxID=573 RepID=UPI002153539F
MIPFLRRWPPEDPQLQEPVVKQTFLSGATLAALVMLVALPLVFILLQAIFPHFSACPLYTSPSPRDISGSRM